MLLRNSDGSFEVDFLLFFSGASSSASSSPEAKLTQIEGREIDGKGKVTFEVRRLEKDSLNFKELFVALFDSWNIIFIGLLQHIFCLTPTT